MGSIQEFRDLNWTYQSWPEALQGVILARVRIPNTPVTIDVYVLHLHAASDGCDRCCREEELQELVEFIEAHSPCSGNPVIVMGDFNIGGPPTCCGNQGYEDILTALRNPRDLWWEAHPCGQPPRLHCGDPGNPCDEPESACFPGECTIPLAPAPEVNYCHAADPFQCNQVTCSDAPAQCLPTCSNQPPAPFCAGWAGYTNDGCVNELSDSQDRIDFIFAITDPSLTSSPFTIDLVDARVADWTMTIQPDTGGAPLHVSDHLGVEATIEIRGGTTFVWVDAAQTGQGNGTACNPYGTVAAGATAVPIGGRVLIRPGLYAEPLTIARACSLEAIGGMVRIGS
jgi:hypothetical protein